MIPVLCGEMTTLFKYARDRNSTNCMLDSTETLTIENVVGTAGIGREIDLQRLAIDLEGADYDPDNFPGIIHRLQGAKPTVLLFRSGKMVCTGGDSVTSMHNAFDIAFDRLRTLGIPVDESPDVVIQNLVMSGDLGNQLNLNAVAIGLGLEQVEYEPEQFPGLIFRVDDPDIVALLFGSGRIVVTGAKSPEDGRNGMKTITTQLNELDLLES